MNAGFSSTIFISGKVHSLKYAENLRSYFYLFIYLKS